jgi:hypothetical protein
LFLFLVFSLLFLCSFSVFTFLLHRFLLSFPFSIDDAPSPLSAFNYPISLLFLCSFSVFTFLLHRFLLSFTFSIDDAPSPLSAFNYPILYKPATTMPGLTKIL